MDLETLAKMFVSVKQKCSEMDTDSGCIIFNGTSRNGYGSIKKRIAGKQTFYYTHRIVMMYTLKNINIGPCSHLCGVKLCVNPEHISIECNIVNNQRKNCHENKVCHGHVSRNRDRLPQCIS